MSNGYKKKSISWYQLYKRIGKQTLHKTRNTKVQVLIDGELKECALVFTNNGSDSHLEPVKQVFRNVKWLSDRGISNALCTHYGYIEGVKHHWTTLLFGFWR